MSILPIKVVGNVPMEMFDDIQTAGAEIGHEPEFHRNVTWRANGLLGPPHDRIMLGALEPMLDVIQETNRKRLRVVAFTVRAGIVKPNGYPDHATRDWHMDGVFFSSVDDYMTANDLYSDFLFHHREPEPGSVLRFTRKIHRSPQNKTEEDIFRVWARAYAYH